MRNDKKIRITDLLHDIFRRVKRGLKVSDEKRGKRVNVDEMTSLLFTVTEISSKESMFCPYREGRMNREEI